MHTILIVDDNAGFRVQARAVLEADGFQVVGEAVDGTSGLADARALRPQLVLLDIGLPDVEGFEVAQALAVDGPPPLVVLTSSREASEYGPRLASSRVLGFIAKDELSGSGHPRPDPGAVTIRVVIADDSTLLREGIARLLVGGGLRRRRAGRGRRRGSWRRSASSGRTWRSWTSGCRRPTPTRA